jgi:putative transcriptional regulator
MPVKDWKAALNRFAIPIRASLGLSQAGFAARFGLSLHSLRDWEQGKRTPDPAARAYLKVIEKAPDMAIGILAE